jgi:hypothetical protein
LFFLPSPCGSTATNSALHALSGRAPFFSAAIATSSWSMTKGGTEYLLKCYKNALKEGWCSVRAAWPLLLRALGLRFALLLLLLLLLLRWRRRHMILENN